MGLTRDSSGRWIAVGLYVALLLASQNVVLSAYMWAFQLIGDSATVSRWVYLFYGLLACGFLVWAKPRGLRAWATLAALLALLVFLFAGTVVPANLLHFAQYGPLTLLLFRALAPRLGGWTRHLGVMAAILAVSVADEAVQSWWPHWDASLPPRRFDAHDIFLNLVAAFTFLLLLAVVIPSRKKEEQREP